MFSTILLVFCCIVGGLAVSLPQRVKRDIEEGTNGWTFFKESASFYKKFYTRLPFDEAEANCQKQYENAHLASFSSKAEFDFLVSLNQTTESMPLGKQTFWIGMHHNGTPKADVAEFDKNRFHVFFTDETPMFNFMEDYEHYWGVNWKEAPYGWEPNGPTGEMCMVIHLNGQPDGLSLVPPSYESKLDDVRCGNHLFYICKIKVKEIAAPLEATTETTTTAEPDTTTTTETSTTLTTTEETTTESTTPSTPETTEQKQNKKCPEGWVTYEETASCFRKFPEKLNFERAELHCQALHAHLASFSSKAEFDFLQAIQLPDHINSYWVGMRHNTTPNEGTTVQDRNHFNLTFIDHSPLPEWSEESEYAHFWARDFSKFFEWQQVWEPNGLVVGHTTEACIELFAPDAVVDWEAKGKLNDKDCNMGLPFACKMSLDKLSSTNSA